MLPDGFHWNHDHSHLLLRSHALIVIESTQRPVSLLNNMHGCLPRHLFFLTHDLAIRYAEMWAKKWEREIRLHLGSAEGAAEVEIRRSTDRAQPAPNWTSTDESRRRKAGASNWPIQTAEAQPGADRLARRAGLA